MPAQIDSPPMTPARWEQVKGLFHETLEHEPTQRLTFLARACAGDALLHNEIESLLRSHEQSESFIEAPAADVAAAVLAQDRPELGLQCGEMLGPFRIAKVLATGGMGEVYLADDSRLGRKVAVKLLPPQFTVNPDRVRRFGQEARAASALNHPNIVTIHEIGQTDSLHFIATEFVDGETLRKHMTNVRMKLDEVLDIANQIASALVAAHAAGIMHRDIKPENVMIRPDGYVKVLDFGLAKLLEPKNKSFLGLKESTQSATGLILGTVNYMSPEQAKGERVDERTDIFSFGVVLYEMLAGQTPFAGDSTPETFANLINAEPQPLSGFAGNVPDELGHIVARTLCKGTNERYQTMKDVLIDLKDVQANLTAEEKLARPDSEIAKGVSQTTNRDVDNLTAGIQDSVYERVQRHKPVAAAALVAFLVGAIGLGYYFLHGNNAAPRIGGKKSIAVLPLKPINTSNRDDIYEIGIAHSLILNIGSINGFNVRPLSATRKYSSLDQDPLAAGKEQQVDYVLAATYQLADEKIRVTAQLLNVANGQVEETYKSGEKDAANVFAVQDAIAGEIGNQLLVRFATKSTNQAAKRGTTNEEAYRLYLQGMYLANNRTPEARRKAVETLEQCVRRDANYAQAWAGLAYAYRQIPNAEGHQKSIEAINKALALDQNLADAYSTLCENKMYYDYDFVSAEQACKRALELNLASSQAHEIYSRFLMSRGRHDEAIAEIKAAIDLEPTSLFCQRNYGLALYYARRYPEAIAQLKRVVELNPNFSSTYYWLIGALDRQGNYPEAFEWLMKELTVDQRDAETMQLLRTAYQTSGWPAVLRELAKAPDYKHDAWLHAMIGNNDEAMEGLERQYRERSLWLAYLQVEPRYDGMRSDPRFVHLVNRVESKK